MPERVACPIRTQLEHQFTRPRLAGGSACLNEDVEQKVTLETDRAFRKTINLESDHCYYLFDQ